MKFNITIKQYARFLKSGYQIKRDLRNLNSVNFEQLYWYDLNLGQGLLLPKMVWIIFKHILSIALTRGQTDQIAENHGITTLHFVPSEFDGLNTPAPTVWNCRLLKSDPIINLDNDITRTLEQHSETIYQEFKNIKNHLNLHPDNSSLVDKGTWKSIFLYKLDGSRKTEFENLCPQTYELLDKLNICSMYGFIGFSALAPNSHITPHCGSSNFRIRYHLGIEIPEPDEAQIRIANQWVKWEAFKAFGFDDSYEHEVIHTGKQDRIVFLVDVWHPMLSPAEIELLSLPTFKNLGR